MEAIKNFINRWKNHGYERGESQKFWIDLLETLGVQNVSEKIFFEQKVKGKYIDAVIPSMRVLIEQKSIGKNLSDAYIQAKNYDNELTFDKKSRWIICSDFQTFELYDMNQENPSPIKVLLKDLHKNLRKFKIFIDKNIDEIPDEIEISLQAGEIVQKLYNTLRKNYLNPDSAESLQSLNKLCVRIVFCLYAESTGILGDKKIFRNYLNQFKAPQLRKNLIDLFKILDTPIEKRDPYLDDDLKKFPYVNGNLFSDEIEIPNFSSEMRYFLLEYASRNFDWSGISPTIFGAVFESTLNPLTRREGGMHYTSIENIHKVIDPLFLDNLREEFNKCKTRKQLLMFQDKLASLKFFDPACGSGNFLTETYLSLRKLENEVLKKLMGEQIQLGEFDNPVKVSINNFYGIEINDFAVSVAQTAMWIAELQMMEKTAEIIHRDINFLPLKNFANIYEGNALRVDWQNICPQADFIIGNPPFVGASMMNSTQKNDAVKIFGKIKLSNSIDYVGAWYHKAARFIENTNTEVTFVSTNSITQGEQVAPLWKNLDIVINFAYRTFKWNSESSEKAHVHCVIIGFAKFARQQKFIFDGDKKILVKNINPYLVDAPTVFIESRAKHIQKFVPKIIHGNKPTDGGNFILSDNEAKKFIKKYPAQAHLIHRYLVAKDFLHGEPIRYCIWLLNVPPNEYTKNREIMRRLEAVKNFRLASSSSTTRKSAETPYKFFSTPQTDENYLCIPQVSSERRRYIPIGFMTPDIIAGDRVLIVPSAQIYHFGILSSSVHMSWVRAVCGRLEMRYNYSVNVVYNNFVWCNPSPEQKNKIEQTAQNILDCRKKYPDASLADLYDELTMPSDLRAAHRKNDMAVAAAYGFESILDDEAKIVAELMKMYESLTKK